MNQEDHERAMDALFAELGDDVRLFERGIPLADLVEAGDRPGERNASGTDADDVGGRPLRGR